MTKFELVIPAYNEAKNLPDVILRAVRAAQESGLSADEFSLIVVQNGSLDNSDEVLELESKNPLVKDWFRVVKVAKNQGYGFGIWQGLSATKSEIIGWSHADQQCDPADAIKAFRMVESSRERNLMVKGERYERNWRDRIVSRTFEAFSRVILGMKVHELNAQPKVFRRHLLGAIKAPPTTFAFDLYVLYQATKLSFRFETIPVRFPPRIHGLSNWASNFMSRYKTILGMIRYMFELRRKKGGA
ncbi:MAG TPA: glycosyltransferase family 2 protein [Oligoflexus sp.]|uniref:glycosyltransferase family 2 protein n=1 Tax=Oligoflexus sp. TaxID=1971216 RepID=UPI002D651512|nr:glycosyltransferase family 2 protein [Oligoflexus sp.]HYX33212.1 glycosyltransferase family 2 protein [Oligoflexus sp.]